MEFTKEDIEKAKLAAGTREVRQIEIEDSDGEEFAFIATIPTRIEWAKYLTDLGGTDDVSRKMLAHQNISLAMAKFPERETIVEFFERKHTCVIDAANELGKLVGSQAKVRSKKL